jgi:hypothetical protein
MRRAVAFFLLSLVCPMLAAARRSRRMLPGRSPARTHRRRGSPTAASRRSPVRPRPAATARSTKRVRTAMARRVRSRGSDPPSAPRRTRRTSANAAPIMVRRRSPAATRLRSRSRIRRGARSACRRDVPPRTSVAPVMSAGRTRPAARPTIKTSVCRPTRRPSPT